MSSAWRLIVASAITTAVIAIFAKTVDLHEVGQAVLQADPWFVLLGIVTITVTMVAKAYRWRLLFFPLQGFSMKGLLSAIYIGYLANTILPLRLGELVRAYLIGEEAQVSKLRALATIVVEKILDVLTLLILLLFMIPFVPLPEVARPLGLIGGAMVALLLAAMVFAWVFQERALQWIGWVWARVPWLRRLNVTHWLELLLAGTEALGSRRTLLQILLWSFVTWLGGAVTNLAILQAMHLPPSLAMAFLVLVIVNLGMAVPALPGYVGSFHAFVVMALLVFSVESSRALAYSIVLHLVVFGTFIIGGLLFVWLGHYRLGILREAPAALVDGESKE